jgi:hypothetical protein
MTSMRVSPEEYRALDLEVHSFLEGVPLRDVSVVELPGGGPDRTISDVRALMSQPGARRANLLVRALFSLRLLVGRVFHWDRPVAAIDDASFARRLTDSHRSRSIVAPGSFEGPFRLLYVFPEEALGEARNATVHAFSCMALSRTTNGYRMYWAIYVLNVSRFTPLYMAIIEPFRRLLVYPSILRQLRAAWVAAYPNGSESPTH